MQQPVGVDLARTFVDEPLLEFVAGHPAAGATGAAGALAPSWETGAVASTAGGASIP
jgi:hypothetical protein